ncbi:MAG: hypothetical protein AAB531_05295 [Patescibacteria group bacterium]
MFHRYILPVSVICFVIAGVLFTSRVFAIGRPDDVGKNNLKQNDNSNSGLARSLESNTAGVSSSSGTTKRQFGLSHKPSFSNARLQNAKLKACEAHSASITRRSSHLVELADKMIKVFTSIANRVEQYYLTKVLPTGATLSSYDELVADITTKENAIVPLLEAAQADAANFTCTGDNPKAQLTQYKTDMQAVIRGLKEYRTAVRNLIVAVRTLPSLKSTATPSATLTPTMTPGPSVTPMVTP